MPKLLLTIALIFTITESLYTQEGWVWQNPLPQGNNISELQFVNTTTAYAMCFNSVMKSTNAGSNWSIHYTNHSQNNTSLHFINETTGFIVSDSGIVLKTVNGGVNWNALYDFHQTKFHKIYFNDINTGYLLRYNYYSIFGTLLYRTTNSGLSWDTIFNDTTITLNDIKFSDSQTGYYAGFQGIYGNNFRYAKIFKSTNGGSNIDSLYTGFNIEISGLKFINNTIFIYGTTGLPYVCGVFSSTNAGLNWIPSDLHKSIKDISGVDPASLYTTTPTGGGGQYLYKSTNNGLNWFNIGSDLKSYEIEFINPTTGISVGSNGQVYKTSNSGVNWNSQVTNLYNFIWGVDFPNATTGYIVDEGHLLKTTNGGTNWNIVFSHGLYHLDFIDANTGYFGGEDSLFKTTNGGLTITQVHYSNSPGVLNEIQFLNANTGFILGKNNLTWKTTNGGVNWNILSGYGVGYHECLFFFNEMLGFVGRDDYNLGWGISRTTNGGINWDFQTIPNVTDYIYDFYFVNSSTGFFTTTGRIFKTTNSGNNWYEVCETTDSFGYWSDIWSIQFLNEYVGYAAASQGKVLKTTDAGNTWKVYNSITNYGFYDLYFTDVNTGYFVGSGGVIIKTTNGCGNPIGIEPISTNIPNEYKLYQNYPNPFNPSTKIKFSIPNSANGKNELTTLKIYDILGKEIAIPVNELLAPGEYEIEWNAENLPSGIYFYTFSGGNYSKTGKMILLK